MVLEVFTMGLLFILHIMEPLYALLGGAALCSWICVFTCVYTLIVLHTLSADGKSLHRQRPPGFSASLCSTC